MAVKLCALDTALQNVFNVQKMMLSFYHFAKCQQQIIIAQTPDTVFPLNRSVLSGGGRVLSSDLLVQLVVDLVTLEGVECGH